MGGKTGTTTGLALLLAAGMAWAGGVMGGEGNRGLSPIISSNICTVAENQSYVEGREAWGGDES
jgi:hypothetical protein